MYPASSAWSRKSFRNYPTKVWRGRSLDQKLISWKLHQEHSKKKKKKVFCLAWSGTSCRFSMRTRFIKGGTKTPAPVEQKEKNDRKMGFLGLSFLHFSMKMQAILCQVVSVYACPFKAKKEKKKETGWLQKDLRGLLFIHCASLHGGTMRGNWFKWIRRW